MVNIVVIDEVVLGKETPMQRARTVTLEFDVDGMSQESIAETMEKAREVVKADTEKWLDEARSSVYDSARRMSIGQMLSLYSDGSTEVAEQLEDVLLGEDSGISEQEKERVRREIIFARRVGEINKSERDKQNGMQEPSGFGGRQMQSGQIGRRKS